MARFCVSVSCALAAAVVLMAGCGDGPHVVPVEGKVQFADGEPLPFGSVMFQPPAGKPARGIIQSDGTFEMTTETEGDGAVVGMNLVRITCTTSQDPAVQARSGDAPVMKLGESLIHERYSILGSSGLTADVKPSDNQPFVFTVERAGEMAGG